LTPKYEIEVCEPAVHEKEDSRATVEVTQMDESERKATVEATQTDESERKATVEATQMDESERKIAVETMRKAPAGVSRGALRGTAVHRVMECLDFRKLLSIDMTSKEEKRLFIRSELQRMLKMALITEEMKELVRENALLAFVESPVALRMAQADEKGDLFREKPFVMDYKGVLVQGIIDVFWLEDEKIVLLDYKTDYVQKADELVMRYATQLNLYADALMRVFSTNMHSISDTEKLIYSFRLDKVIEITEKDICDGEI